MYDFHKDKSKYFKWQYQIAKEYVIPFVESDKELTPKSRILEIGCAEAGVLMAFVEEGYECVGIELSESRANRARQFLKDSIETGQTQILSSNIYDIDPEASGFKFDLIILKDVIEHIFDQEKFMHHLKKFLTPGGRVFFGFPPWQMPFGGHQQIADSKVLSKLPYFHLLPTPIYKGILKVAKESDSQYKELLEIKETGISIERFERHVKDTGFEITASTHFLTNPIYKLKFGLKPREQFGLVTKLPYLRNFMTTAVYYLIEKKK